jgi:hypothetical protein
MLQWIQEVPMSAKRRESSKPPKRTAPSQPPPEILDKHPQTEVGTFTTDACELVAYMGEEPYEYITVFRPGAIEILKEIDQLLARGEEPDPELEERLEQCGTLMLSVDESSIVAELYLDADLVDEDEVDALVAGVSEFLDRFPLGPDGGLFNVYWMEPIVTYAFGQAPG